MDTLFKVEKLKFSYNNKEIFSDLSFEVGYNELVSILLPNGGGKSTLINLLSGLLPSNDCITLDNILLTRKTGKKYLRRIGVIFEDLDAQFLTDVVYDELILPLANLNYSKKEIKNRIKTITSILGIEDLLDYYVDSLSTYDKVRVLLACSLIHNPQIIFLDDVFRNLTNSEERKLIVLLKTIVDLDNVSIVLTTSDFSNIIYSNKVYVIDDGKLSLDGSVRDILEYDNRLSKLGIKLPIMIDISLKLKFYDLLDDIIFDEEKMVDVLWD